MSTYTQTQTVPVTTPTSTTTVFTSRALSWGAILAGCVAALSAHLLLTLFSLGIGLQTAQPMTNDNVMADITVAAGISWSISALISLWIGGWVAARFADVANHKVGRLHGFVVWSLATVVTFASFTLGAGALATGAAKLAGKTLSVAGNAAGAVAPAAGDAFQMFMQSNGGIVSSFLDEVSPEQTEGGDPAATTRARREIGWALYGVFGEEGAASSPENRAELVQAVSRNTGRSQQESEELVNGWVGSYEQAREQLQAQADRAEQRAREAAEAAADATTKTAVWTFIAFIIGAAAAIWGGHVGARRWWNADYPEVSRHPFPQT